MRTSFKIALASTGVLLISIVIGELIIAAVGTDWSLALAEAFADRIPPRDMTELNMFLTKRRIIRYARPYNHLPADFSDLAPMAGYNNDTTDAWGRPLDYSFDAKGIVTLRSLGADKQPGGDGDNRDMTGIFASRDANGHWRDEFVDWIQDPLQP